MRCPTCNTENAPDSRFCGGCGAKLYPAEKPRLAPTHKILDDSPYPPQTTKPVPPSGPVSYAPPSMPPNNSVAQTSNQRPVSKPPRAQSSLPAPRPRPSGSEAFAAPPHRPIGLIVAILIVDLGLAAAGAVLLVKGLGTQAQAVAPAPPQKAEEPPPPPAKTEAPPAPPPPAPIEQQPPPEEKKPKGESKPAAARKDKPKDDKKAGSGSGSATTPPEPIDPDKGPNYEAEVLARSAKSKAAFDKCGETAGNPKGTIQIIFEIQRDGSVRHAAPADNSTGSDELARCLGAEISKWKLSPHKGPIAQFMKSFIFQ